MENQKQKADSKLGTFAAAVPVWLEVLIAFIGLGIWSYIHSGNLVTWDGLLEAASFAAFTGFTSLARMHQLPPGLQNIAEIIIPFIKSPPPPQVDININPPPK